MTSRPASPQMRRCNKTNLSCYHGQCVPKQMQLVEDGVILPRCICDRGWSGIHCNLPCTLHCLNSGTCVTSHRHDTVCRCWHNKTVLYTGRLCGKLAMRQTTPATVAPESRVDVATIVGVSVGTFLFLVLIFIICLVVLWKKRDLFVMKLHHRFKAYDDKDNKTYDAFISYKASSADHTSSHEEQYVVNELLPKLEREYGFRICVDFRDFSPGLSISDNVLWAIDNSHRTIMLISRSYILESFWSMSEYEQAQVAVVQQKERFIPIIFEDISDIDISDSILKLILDSTTYIERPAATDDKNKKSDFWTRLHLSMPKKRASSALPMTA